jgi:hypothetical protein
VFVFCLFVFVLFGALSSISLRWYWYRSGNMNVIMPTLSVSRVSPRAEALNGTQRYSRARSGTVGLWLCWQAGSVVIIGSMLEMLLTSVRPPQSE